MCHGAGLLRDAVPTSSARRWEEDPENRGSPSRILADVAASLLPSCESASLTIILMT